MKELIEMQKGVASELTDSEDFGHGAHGAAPPDPATRDRCVTVLAENSEYLTWVLNAVGRNMLTASQKLTPLNPMRIAAMMTCKFMKHPNAWRLIVGQVAQMREEDFERYWPNFAALVRAIDE